MWQIALLNYFSTIIKIYGMWQKKKVDTHWQMKQNNLERLRENTT